jgi:phosphopantothenoylcysteine decarboxylase/phosphopantothenate--cysteine ligase
MAAAVADFRPDVTKTSKIRRAEAPFALSLEPVPDLLAECAAAARPNQLLVGFALEPAAELLARASQKLTGKGIDLIVGNPLETMGSRMIEATLVAAEQSKLPLTRMPAQSKEAFADELLRHCMLLWETKLNRLM